MATIRAQSLSTNWAALIEGCILAGLGAMLLRKTWDGQLPLYIHPRYSSLVLASSLLILLLGAFRLWQTGERAEALRGRIGVYALLLAPLLLGVLIPAKPAGSSLIDPRQLNNVGRGYAANGITEEDSAQWTLMDWLFARYTLQPEEIKGKPVDVIGFVYRDPENPQPPSDEFHVVRYTLACCVADRSSVSLPVKWDAATALPNDQWVRVTGKIDLRPGDGPPELIVTEARVEPVQQPSEPYLYP
jgi:putative membrane protein